MLNRIYRGTPTVASKGLQKPGRLELEEPFS